MSPTTSCVSALIECVLALRSRERPASEVFLASGAVIIGDEELVVATRAALHERPDLVQLWQDWSYDKRWSPSPYLDGLEVGHYDAGRHNVRHHATSADACADFVLTEMRWVVERRVVKS